MEAGHQNISLPPTSPSAFIAFVQSRVRDGASMVEWDDVCSGRGLQLAYEWCSRSSDTAVASESALESTSQPAGAPTLVSAADVAAAWKSNAVAAQAMLLHYELIMRFAANFCVVTQAEAVVFAGDNQSANAEFVLAHSAQLHAAFVDHSMDRVAFLSRVKVWTQRRAIPLSLMGTMGVAVSIGSK